MQALSSILANYKRVKVDLSQTQTLIGSLKENLMLHYAIVFFIIALIAALLGFTGIAASATGIAKILFVVFLIMAVVAFVVNRTRG